MKHGNTGSTADLELKRQVVPFQVPDYVAYFRSQQTLLGSAASHSKHRPAKNRRRRESARARRLRYLSKVEEFLAPLCGNRWIRGKVRISIAQIPPLRHLLSTKPSDKELMLAVHAFLKNFPGSQRDLVNLLTNHQ